MSLQTSHLAPYATLSQTSRGRLYREEESPTRSPFQRDRDRIIHCATFRRLKHKTQVFVYHEGDYYRTRLTHSIEVSQIARSICRAMHLDEDLGEALALAHDFGHTAFGHAGEVALNGVMKGYGGFDHNAQSLRLVTKLEKRYAEFEGLNLTWETLEGLAKHNGPLVGSKVDVNHLPDHLPFAFRDYLPKHDLEIHTFAGAEAQVAALSDDIAYNNHDIEDGLRAGLFVMEDLMDIPFIRVIIKEVDGKYPDIPHDVRVHEVVRRLINAMVMDLIGESDKRLTKANPKRVEDIRGADRALISFSDDMIENDRLLKTFLYAHMYEHPKVLTMQDRGKNIVTSLFNLYIDEPERLPDEWQRGMTGPRTPKTARKVADFIAGMTDRFAIQTFKKEGFTSADDNN